MDVAIIGANGFRLDVAGKNAGRQGVILAAGQVQGIYGAPISSEWKRAARERGGRFKDRTFPWRDITLGFHLFGDEGPMDIARLDSLLDQMITDAPDKYDPDEQLARIVVKSKRDTRRLFIQRQADTDLDPEFDPTLDDEQYLNPIYRVRSGQPFWEGRKKVTVFTSEDSSASGYIEVSNPTPIEMWQSWVLTRAEWTIPDPSWIGPKGKRVPGGEFGDRVVELLPIADAHAGARINYDPMRLMLESWAGVNLLGENGGRDYFMHKIPPYTPPTRLPISYKNSPSGGARAELHQPRLWPKPWGGELL
ncbi:hypothetical protein [Rhodococcus spongiicola]|uniref:Minor tail protein n=1 Tax=Rhodococcus spongiicola TaxID=2487352 RepID=A0A3S3E5I0_9NOCA|nr:hypothetical protein [Rhodococcus spongiicola]RVW06221.1 hypothetical protein EF834_01835 [Rhodococcus spongiicola]